MTNTRIQTPKSETAIAQMFDKIAPKYDFLNALLSAKQDKRWRKKLIENIPEKTNGVFVDMATGTGDVLIQTAKLRTEYSELSGGDISAEMLSIATKKSQKLDKETLKKINWQKMSAEKTPYNSNSVDCLSIAFGLRNVINKPNALKEFNRILKPQGTFLVLEFFPMKETFFSKIFQFYFNSILPKIGGLIGDKKAYRYLPDSVGSFYKANEFESALTENGFKLEKTTSFMFGSCLLVKALKI